MIKCICKETVQDKYTGENYKVGNEYEFTKERAEEVTNTRYFEYAKVVEEVKEDKPKRTRKSIKK